MFTIKAAKGNFFDRKAVMDRVGPAKVKVLSRQGALVRRIMQRSMRKRKGAAPPGQPPNAHQGDLKDKLYFAYDERSDSVVVGPVKLGKSDVPETLDKGGVITIRGIRNRKGEFVPLRLLPPEVRVKVVASGKYTTQTVKFQARPFSQPALVKAAPYLAKEWQGAVKK